MKNKEIEELLNNIKEQLIIDEKLGKEIAQDFHKTILNYEETNLLLSYIEQLENNRDKAIEFIENHFLYHYGSYKAPIVFEDNYIQKIVDILKGGSDE